MNCNNNNNKALQLIESVKTARITATGSNTNKNSNNKISAIINTNNNKTLINQSVTTNKHHINIAQSSNNNNPTLLQSQQSQSQQSPQQHLIPKLTSITNLDYSNNKITTIPKHIHLTYTKLTSLNLSHN